MNLRVGNYWVYDWFEIDLNNNATLLDRTDSVIIEKDTIINNKSYFVKKSFYGSPLMTRTILFDSMNSYPDKKVIFTLDKSLMITQNLGPETKPTLIGYYAIDDTETSVEVPAGSFQSINFKGRIEPQDGDYPYGVRYNDNYYSKNIGLIKVATQLYSSPNNLELRLTKFGSLK